jgi:hypothetical protein
LGAHAVGFGGKAFGGVQAAMERDDTRQPGTCPCEFKDPGATKTIADRCHLRGIGPLVRLQQVEPGGQALAEQGAVAFVDPRLLAGFRRLWPDAFAVNVRG